MVKQLPDYVASDWDDAKRQALALADTHGEEPVYSPEYIEEVASAVEVLMVVYPDETESQGIGMVIAKGESRLADVSATGKPKLLVTTAIHGAELFHAVAIRDRLAAGPTQH